METEYSSPRIWRRVLRGGAADFDLFMKSKMSTSFLPAAAELDLLSSTAAAAFFAVLPLWAFGLSSFRTPLPKKSTDSFFEEETPMFPKASAIADSVPLWEKSSSPSGTMKLVSLFLFLPIFVGSEAWRSCREEGAEE